jgi:hypothetical protein
MRMTAREQQEMMEQKIRMLEDCQWECEVCGKAITLHTCQLAHRIPKTKHNLKTYGKRVIHHPFNLACVCGLKCNSAVLLNPATHPLSAKELLDDIQEDLDGRR